jgi:hypothetical protein
LAFTYRDTYVAMEPLLWYNVSLPVGRAAANRGDDVALVQVLLSLLRPYLRVLGQPLLKPLSADGLYGPITESYIDAYQSAIHFEDRSFRPDGLVEPAPKGITFSRHVGRGRTIQRLNWDLWSKAKAAHQLIPTSPYTPSYLRTALSVVR